MSRYDVAIIGSGFASSILARVLRRGGRSVLLLEKGRHPRFALGESTTPLANFALERLAARYGLEDLHQLSSHGRWLADLPHLRRGLKRGFTFFKHHPGQPYQNSSANEARLLVAASPNDWIADTHWLRADVDCHLVERALEEGVDVHQDTAVVRVNMQPAGVCLETVSMGVQHNFEADVVVDGSGPRGVLARSLNLPAQPTPEIDTSLLFGHFEGVLPFSEVASQGGAEFTPGPYPDDYAAVHHLLAEGWMYALPFDHGVASVGIVLRRGSLPAGLDLQGDSKTALESILRRYPSLEQQFAGARPVMPVGFIPRLPHRLGRAAGPRWFLLPHSFAFYDPLFSTGMAWSLLAVERIAQILEGHHGTALGYEKLLCSEADQGARLIAAAHLAMKDFRLFTAVCGLYFATVSYLEAGQRLLAWQEGMPSPAWHGFLGADEPRLQRLFRETLKALRRMSAQDASEEVINGFTLRLGKGIQPFDVVGLDLRERHNLHPVDLGVLLDRAHLLGLSRSEMERALKKLRRESLSPH